MKETEILDDVLYKSAPKNDLIKRMAAYITCGGGVIISMFVFNLRNTEIIAGLVLLIISAFITYKKMNVGVIIFFFVLLASCFDLISYFHININFMLLNVNMFIILLIHVFLNQDILIPVTEKTISEIRETENSISTINRFKTRFANYPQEKLQKIIIENQYVPEAIQAAKELMQENYSSEIK